MRGRLALDISRFPLLSLLLKAKSCRQYSRAFSVWARRRKLQVARLLSLLEREEWGALFYFLSISARGGGFFPFSFGATTGRFPPSLPAPTTLGQIQERSVACPEPSEERRMVCCINRSPADGGVAAWCCQFQQRLSFLKLA